MTPYKKKFPIKEDSWSLSQNWNCYEKAIKYLKDFERSIYHELGDDELFDYLDGAMERIKELREIAFSKKTASSASRYR